MKLNIFQKGFNYSQDGPGNRLIYHLSGCNMRCPWCSNPEGLKPSAGSPYTVEELTGEVLRSSMLFFDGGGLTLTGGEFSLQLPAASALLASVHGSGIDTCVETNGTAPALQTVFPSLDHLIIDVKHYDENRLSAVCGAGLKNTLSNLACALDLKMDVLIRIPLIGGFNASPEDAARFAELFCSLDVPGHARVEVLKYHEFGKDKYQKLGLPYTMTEEAFISTECFHTFRDILVSHGIEPATT
ncbi:MAG: radical SAM protein [Lachnospiraceae bacterium]|nr:radical SAM protein [Lachnospiraceae bacterium]